MRRGVGLTPALAAMLIGATAAGADTLTTAVRDVTVISDGNGSSHVLFDTASLGNLGNVAISRATITFSLSGSAVAERVSLRLHPVTSSWSPGGASWTSWSRPGGDFDDGVYSRTELDLARSGTVSIDATSLLKEMIEGGMTAYGFILTEGSGGGNGLSTAAIARLQNLGSATLELHYRKTPPKPRGA